LKKAAKAAKSLTQQDEFGKQSLIACKSNHFSTLEELATDVFKRIEHHNRVTANVTGLIQRMFLPVSERNKELHTNILENILNILRPKDAIDESAGQDDSVIQVDDDPEGVEFEDTHHSTQTISNGTNVLARCSSSSTWSEGFVRACKGTGYIIVLWDGGKEVHVSEDNIKHIDWDHCKLKMQSWGYSDFKEAIDEDRKVVQVAEQTSMAVVALQKLCVGTVVADHTEFASYEEGGRSSTEGQCNCELLWVDRPQKDSSEEDNTVGFVVTTKDIAQGERLEWLCELRRTGQRRYKS